MLTERFLFVMVAKVTSTHFEAQNKEGNIILSTLMIEAGANKCLLLNRE